MTGQSAPLSQSVRESQNIDGRPAEAAAAPVALSAETVLLDGCETRKIESHRV